MPEYIGRPEAGEYNDRFHEEIMLVDCDNLLQALRDIRTHTLEILSDIPEEKLHYRYAEGKWTVKEVWQHVVEVERVLGYRAMCYSRGETAPLPGFDEKRYTDMSGANGRHWADILEEYAVLRQSNIKMFEAFTPEMCLRVGRAGVATVITARAVGFLIAGHNVHHLNMLRERYL